ncbi:hypothetical protein [Nocardioides sp. NPDC127503]|uniref:hypothetical protein n=1 Tax=Nocardioides sp. NPDC127503 TaxID=3154516 RepID=UPI00331B3CD1
MKIVRFVCISFIALALANAPGIGQKSASAAWGSPANFSGFSWITPSSASGAAPSKGTVCNYSADAKGSTSTACWQRSGDVVWVKDQRADGRSAIARISVIVGGSRDTKFVCRNKLGVGKWVKCTKNLAEPGTIFFKACAYDAKANRMSTDCTAAQSAALAV